MSMCAIRRSSTPTKLVGGADAGRVAPRMGEPLLTQPRFPGLSQDAGHYESFYLKRGHPTEPVGDLDPLHGPQAARTSRRRARSGSRCSTARGRPARPSSRPSADARAAGDGDYIRVGDSRFEPGRVDGRRGGPAATRPGSSRFSRERAAVPPPAARLHVRRAAAAHEAAQPASGRPLQRPRRGRRAHRRARRLGRHGRPQLGRPARRALDLDARRRASRATATPGSTARSAASRSARGLRRGSATECSRSTASATVSEGSSSIARDQGRRAARRRPLHAAGRRTSPSRGTSAPTASDFVGWIYADPDGSEHNTVNCSIADMTLTVSRPGAAAADAQVAARRGLRARHARERPRHGDPAVPGRLESGIAFSPAHSRIAMFENMHYVNPG